MDDAEKPIDILQARLQKMATERDRLYQESGRLRSAADARAAEASDLAMQIFEYEEAIAKITTAKSPAASGDNKM